MKFVIVREIAIWTVGEELAHQREKKRVMNSIRSDCGLPTLASSSEPYEFLEADSFISR